jgi:peroxiredoxin
MKKAFITIALLVFTVSIFAQLPQVTLKTLDGKSVSTDTLNNGGKPFIISFFALWCKPCQRELKAIAEVYDEWREETGVKVFAVSIDEAQNVQKVKPLVNQNEWEYDVLLDPNSDFKRALGVNMIPAVFVIDGNGKIADSRTSYTDGSEQHLIEKVRELIGKKE